MLFFLYFLQTHSISLYALFKIYLEIIDFEKNKKYEIPYYLLITLQYSPWAQRGHHAPLRTLLEWYNIVHWIPLIKSQDVNTRYLGLYPPFLMDFKMAAVTEDKMPIW